MAEKKIPRLSSEERKARKRARDQKRYWSNRDKILAQKHEYSLTHQEERHTYNQKYYDANQDELRAYALDYAAGHRAEKRVYNALYYARNQEELQRAQNAYDAVHREERRIYQLVFRAENQDKIHAWQKMQRARKKNAPINDFTAKQWRALCKASGYRCAYCKQKFPFKQLTQDHITPLAKGGSHTLSNIIPACLPCNLRKHTRDVPCPVQPFLLVDEAAAD